MRDRFDRVGVVGVVDAAVGIVVVLAVIDWPPVVPACSQGPSEVRALAAGRACLAASELEAYPSFPSDPVQVEARSVEYSSVWLGAVDVDEVGSADQAGNWSSEARNHYGDWRHWVCLSFPCVRAGLLN